MSKLRSGEHEWETVQTYRPLPPASQPSRPERRRRTAGRPAPPADPGLRAFLEELGRMAGDAVLARLANHRRSKGGGEPSIKPPRGSHRSDAAKKAGVSPPAGDRHSSRVRQMQKRIPDATGKAS